MSVFSISVALHTIAFVLWMGGLLIITRCLKPFTSAQCISDDNARELAKTTLGVIRRITYGFVIGGLVLSLLTGLYQLFYRGTGFYFSQGWFHGKLTLLGVLVVVTWFVLGAVRTASRGLEENRIMLKPSRLIMLHAITGTCLVIIVLLVKRVIL